ncbi:hypothetical protein GGX14DRAFT_402142 [Mycena pura]|uniref:Uncharacterized protein n=1 Tax=Mycena pura TaxID=153505 RepID=A0AAD6UZ05_9AGAR|nr:hypothetical protein GGX14DRAFT_402142 [Mycena pura]
MARTERGRRECQQVAVMTGATMFAPCASKKTSAPNPTDGSDSESDISDVESVVKPKKKKKIIECDSDGIEVVPGKVKAMNSRELFLDLIEVQIRNVTNLNWDPMSPGRNILLFANSGSITNCGRIILKDWYRFQVNRTKTEGVMRESVGGTKKFPKRKYFVRAFGSDISCNSKFEVCCAAIKYQGMLWKGIRLAPTIENKSVVSSGEET